MAMSTTTPQPLRSRQPVAGMITKPASTASVQSTVRVTAAEAENLADCEVSNSQYNHLVQFCAAGVPSILSPAGSG